MERNQEQKKEKSMFVQYELRAQRSTDKWAIDNGFSSHMTEEKKIVLP
jgi:hypothetical protein